MLSMSLSPPGSDPSQLNAEMEPLSEFQHLMRFRVHEILLVSSLYDSFILAGDGQLSELILSEFVGLNIYQAPTITRVSSATEALELIRAEPRFDVILTTMHIGEMPLAQFAKETKRLEPTIPLILLTYENPKLLNIPHEGPKPLFNRVYMWQGDFRILLAMVKQVEDLKNLEHDTRQMGVQVIIVVEDNIRYYSSFLPLFYSEILHHSQSLISEGVNLAQKMLRMRARPKLILCETLEEAWDYFTRYEQYVLGVITDNEFYLDKAKKNKDPYAGRIFARRIKERSSDIPIVLQSFDPRIKDIAIELNVGFIKKDSPTLLSELRQFLVEKLGFGDFLFRMPDGAVIDHARDLMELEEKLRTIPDECLRYHAERNHFSAWLKARTEFELATRLRPRKVSDWPSLKEMRQDIIRHLSLNRLERKQKLIAEFQRETFNVNTSFAYIGSGSLGGKARGLAFISHYIQTHRASDRFADVKISIPQTVVLCTDVFDRFMRYNGLYDFGLHEDDDQKILNAFSKADFPPEYIKELMDVLDLMRFPLAVRSSSLLEDSQYQPFAGVYSTFMLRNNQHAPRDRLSALLKAIKLVYASVYLHRAKGYISATPYRLEEEKMAVIIQQLVGTKHNRRFYPDISGVARSHNFYPKPPTEAADGVAFLALGMGKLVVEGGQSIRFCPKYPRHSSQFTTTTDYQDHTQKYFYALDLAPEPKPNDPPDFFELTEYSLKAAENDGTLQRVGSIYSPENDAVYDGLSRNGIPLVTFALVLKTNTFPLPGILQLLMTLGRDSMGGPVEFEFAVNLTSGQGKLREFAVLQMRPMVLQREVESLDIHETDPTKLLCSSDMVMGVGLLDDIKDILAVNMAGFDRSRSREVAQEIEGFNIRLLKENRPYILIGGGRWGSADPWLGIPVQWDQISASKVIVETGFEDIRVAPSLGAHFFHNLTSFMVGYFTIQPTLNEGVLDWNWLKSLQPHQSSQWVKHFRFDKACIVKMNGLKNQGIIYKPGITPNGNEVSASGS